MASHRRETMTVLFMLTVVGLAALVVMLTWLLVEQVRDGIARWPGLATHRFLVWLILALLVLLYMCCLGVLLKMLAPWLIDAFQIGG
jgi:hypothetical protein